MSKLKHTPGPWYVRPRNGPGHIAFEVCHSSDDECITDGVYEESNARLIAKAPELLDALRELVEAHSALCRSTAGTVVSMEVESCEALLALQKSADAARAIINELDKE